MRKSCFVILSLLAACASEGQNTTTSDSSCAAKLKWAGGNTGSPYMNPGQDCVACHTKEGEGPKFPIAGTVFGQSNEPDLCQGKSAITVEITGSDGKVTTLTTNEAGNFQLDGKQGSVALPYTARVVYGGKERKMVSPQNNGSCNSCHGAKGSNGAPGRVLVPE